MPELELLKRIPLFRDCSDKELVEVGNLMQRTDFKANDVIFKAGDSGDAIYLIIKGEVEVLVPSADKDDDCWDALVVLGPGELFGEMALIEDMKRSATLRAVSDCKMWKIKKLSFDEFVGAKSEIAYKIYKNLTSILCRRLRETTAHLAENRFYAKVEFDLMSAPSERGEWFG